MSTWEDTAKREQDIRAQALGLAVRTIDVNSDPVDIAGVLDLADVFVTYIATGAHTRRTT